MHSLQLHHFLDHSKCEEKKQRKKKLWNDSRGFCISWKCVHKQILSLEASEKTNMWNPLVQNSSCPCWSSTNSSAVSNHILKVEQRLLKSNEGENMPFVEDGDNVSRWVDARDDQFYSFQKELFGEGIHSFNREFFSSLRCKLFKKSLPVVRWLIRVLAAKLLQILISAIQSSIDTLFNRLSQCKMCQKTYSNHLNYRRGIGVIKTNLQRMHHHNHGYQ